LKERQKRANTAKKTRRMEDEKDEDMRKEGLDTSLDLKIIESLKAVEESDAPPSQGFMYTLSAAVNPSALDRKLFSYENLDNLAQGTPSDKLDKLVMMMLQGDHDVSRQAAGAIMVALYADKMAFHAIPTSGSQPAAGRFGAWTLTPAALGVGMAAEFSDVEPKTPRPSAAGGNGEHIFRCIGALAKAGLCRDEVGIAVNLLKRGLDPSCDSGMVDFIEAQVTLFNVIQALYDHFSESPSKKSEWVEAICERVLPATNTNEVAGSPRLPAAWRLCRFLPDEVKLGLVEAMFKAEGMENNAGDEFVFVTCVKFFLRDVKQRTSQSNDPLVYHRWLHLLHLADESMRASLTVCGLTDSVKEQLRLAVDELRQLQIGFRRRSHRPFIIFVSQLRSTTDMIERFAEVYKVGAEAKSLFDTEKAEEAALGE